MSTLSAGTVFYCSSLPTHPTHMHKHTPLSNAHTHTHTALHACNGQYCRIAKKPDWQEERYICKHPTALGVQQTVSSCVYSPLWWEPCLWSTPVGAMFMVRSGGSHVYENLFPVHYKVAAKIDVLHSPHPSPFNE